VGHGLCARAVMPATRRKVNAVARIIRNLILVLAVAWMIAELN
jgi:hypothetical protein